MGRDPNHFELAVFSLLWSEHCAYKHSALLLRRLPSSGPRVLQGPGENAGVIDLGEGEAVAFKVESHNHPSAVEPFQGAATGVGGIIRDIVAMGARPVALLDGLCFGEPDWHFERAVEGIGHYGNCVGIPTVGGDTVFDRRVPGQLPRQRHVRRARPVRPRHPRPRRTPGPDGRPLRVDHRPRRHRRRERARQPGAGRGVAREAAVRAGRRPLHREEADRGRAWSSSRADWSSRCRTAARPGSLPRSRRWRATAPASTSTSTASRCARRAWSRGRS